MTAAEADVAQTPKGRQELWQRMRVPAFAFIALLGFAWACILFGMVLLDYLSR